MTSWSRFGCANWTGDTKHFAPVQLKEVALSEKGRDVNDILKSLEKYSGVDEDLTVVVQFNRRETFSPKKIVVPPRFEIAALWFLFCTQPDQSEWMIWGDFLGEPEGTRFAYPV